MKMKINGIEYRSAEEFYAREKISDFKVRRCMKQFEMTKKEAMEHLLQEKKVREQHITYVSEKFHKTFTTDSFLTTGRWTDQQRSICQKLADANAPIDQIAYAVRRSNRSVAIFMAKNRIGESSSYSNDELKDIIRKKNPKNRQELREIAAFTGASYNTVASFAKRYCGFGAKLKHEDEIAALAKEKLTCREMAKILGISPSRVNQIAWCAAIKTVNSKKDDRLA